MYLVRGERRRAGNRVKIKKIKKNKRRGQLKYIRTVGRNPSTSPWSIDLME
jgi:hypothetical protein